MAMNHEFERHIEAAKKEGKLKGVDALKSMQILYETLALVGIVPILQQESIEMPTKTKTRKGQRLMSFVISESMECVKLSIEPEKLSFGQAVAYFRIQRNFSQKELGNKAGNLSQAAISGIEHGSLFASDKAWANILKALSTGEEDPAIALLKRKRAEELIKRKGGK